MLPVDPTFRENRRDDGYTDFAELKSRGQVRTKQGNIVSIDEPRNKWSPRQRDDLYQSYCRMMTSSGAEPTPREIRRWLEAKANELNMSVARAMDIINEGNGQYPGCNMQWWRGVSVE